jgi:hypothetical protein
VSEETTSMERAQTNLGRLVTMHVLFGGARGPANCVRTVAASATVTALRKNIVTRSFTSICPATTIPIYSSICGGENNHRLEHTFLNLPLSVADSEKRRDLVRSTDSEAAARWKCLQRQRQE